MNRKKKLFLVAIFCIIIVIIIVIVFTLWLYINADCFDCNGFIEPPNIYFDENEENNTIFVVEVESFGEFSKSDFVWENIEIIGNGTKPNGEINTGDVITNCSGYVGIIFIPDNIMWYDHEFLE